jgi:HSP20 family molecular chaperone IbpA
MIYGNSDLNDLFDTFFNNKGRGNYNYSTTVVKNDSEGETYEINHTKDGAYLFFEAAGFNKSNLKAEMEDGILFIEGKRTYKLNGEEKTKSISKQFKIGEGYNPTSLEATIEDGLLTVFVPNYKKQEKKRISIL